MKSRIAKVISNRGYCSRRDAEKLVLEGRVKVFDQKVIDVATNVEVDADIAIDGKKIQLLRQTRLWIYHKPLGIITTRKDPQGRKTVFDAFSAKEHLVSIGRLDINSQGLLLITNDKALAAKLENPVNNYARIYKVRFFGRLPDEFFSIRDGIIIDGLKYKPIKVEILKSDKLNSWCQMELREGKNREIRKIFAFFGLQVSRLIRIAYGPFQLGDLKVGAIREVKNISC